VVLKIVLHLFEDRHHIIGCFLLLSFVLIPYFALEFIEPFSMIDYLLVGVVELVEL
jgi:hypothetical protein